jgi:hypothetical protein
LPEGRDGLFDRALDSFDVCSVRLDRDRLSAIEFNRFDYGGSRAGVITLGLGRGRPFGATGLRDGGAAPPRPASDERNLTCQVSLISLAHIFPF